jgi:hypothetical protein
MDSAQSPLEEVHVVDRGLGIWVDTDDRDPDGECAVLLVAYHALWAVVHEPPSLPTERGNLRDRPGFQGKPAPRSSSLTHWPRATMRVSV